MVDEAGVIPSLSGEGIGIALASAQCAILHWREGGSAAAPAYQHAFARQMRRPIAVAELVSGLARHPVSTTLALSLIARFPGALRLIAEATRICSRCVDDIDPAACRAHIRVMDKKIISHTERKDKMTPNK